MIVMSTQTEPWTPEEIATAEKAWSLRVHGHKTYVQIAEELAYEETARCTSGEVAMQAVSRFQAEIDGGLRSEPPDPKRRRPRR